MHLAWGRAALGGSRGSHTRSCAPLVLSLALLGGCDEEPLGEWHLDEWPEGVDPQTVGARVAQRFAAEGHTPTSTDGKHYKVACAWYGSLGVGRLLQDQAMLDGLVASYEPYKATWTELLGEIGHVDENVFGMVPLEIALVNQDPVALQEGLAIADQQVTNIERHTRYAIDDMFMITGLQMQAYRATMDPKYLDTAAVTMVDYLETLQQEDGLFFHHRNFEHKWGRGNGWVAAGMAELLQDLPETHPNFEAVRQGYERMMDSLVRHQRKGGPDDGLWRQIIDSKDERNWAETSGSAMFTYALVTGIRLGWLEPEKYGRAARAAWLGLVARLDDEAALQDISDWAYLPSSHGSSAAERYADDEENYYFERPKRTGDNHGQAPMLWTAGALLRLTAL